MTSVAAVLQSCQNRNDKKCPYKPFGETQLLVNISLQSALDSHKLLRQLLSSFNDGDGKSQENIQMKEKNICLVSHFLRQSLELLLGKQNKELLITINFTLKISSHFSCFNMSSHLVKDSFHMLNSLPRDIPDRINTVALFLQACSKLVNRHVSTTRKQEEQDDVIHLLDCICAYLQDDCIALISDNNIQNYIAFCCDSVISYVFTSDKVLTSSSHSAQLEAVLKISVRHQLKCRLDLSRTLDAVAVRVLSTSGKQVDAEEKVVLLLQGVLETLSDRSVDKSQACHALTLVFNIYCRLADSTNARLLSILSAIMRIVTIEIALCRDALLDVMNHLLSAQPDAAANCLIDLPSHCSCDGLPTNVVRDLHFAHMLVEMRLWVSASPSYSLVNSLSSSAYFWQKTLLADLRKSKNVTALVKVYRLQIAIMTQCHRHIQRVHSPEFCPMRWRILQFVSRLLVFSRDICCAEIFPFVSPFINGVGAILSVAFPLTIDCADQLDSEILNSFFRNLRSFCSSLVLDLKSNLNYIAESSLSLAKLCFLCVSPKFQVITKHSMESMDFFHLTESVITGLSLNDPKTVSVEADSPIARLLLLYSQLYFYQLRKLDSNMRSECAILAVSKEFWTFVGDLRIGGALLNHFCNNFYTEGKSSILDSVSNPENRVRDLVNLFNMCVSCGCSHHSELAESLQTDLRCYLIRLLMLVGQASNNGLISMLRSFDTKTELHSKVSESEKPVSVVNQIVFVRRNIAGAESVQFEGIWNVDSAAEGRIRSALLDAMHGLKQIVHSLTSTSFSSDFITIYLLRIFPSDLRRLFQLLHIHGCKLEQANLLKFVEKVLSSSEFQRVSITKVLGRSEIVCLWSSLSKEFQCLLSIDKFIRNDIARGDCLPLELFPSDTSWAETIDRFCRICSGLFLIEDVSAELDISVFDSLLQSCLSAARSHCASLPKDSAKEVAEPLCAWLNLTAARIYICVFGDYARCENSITSSIDCAGLSTQFYLRMIQAECSLTSADLCDVRGDPEGASLKATEAVAYATSVSPSFCNICKLHVSRIYYRLNQSEHLQELLTSIIYGEKEREVPGSNLCIVDVAKILFDTFISNKDLLSGIDARFRYTDRLWNLTNLCRSSVRAPLAFNACKFSLLLQNWYVCWDQVSVIVDKSSSRKMFDSLVASAAKLDLKVPFDFNSEIRSRLCKAAMQLEIDSFAQFWISCSSIGVTMEYMKTCETSTGGLINLLHNDKHDELKARLEHLCNRGVDTIIFLRVDQAENRVIVGRYDTDGSLVEVNIACEARAFLHCYDKWIQLVNDCNSQLHNNSDSDASARGSNSAKKEWWSRRSAIDDKFKSLLGEIEGILGPALRLIAASSILDSSLDKLADLSLDEKNAEISSAPTPDYAAMKVSELKQLLTAKGIAFNAKALKADLVSILSQVDFTQEIEVCRRSSTANEILSPESRASLNNTNTGASVFDIHHQGQQSIRASGRVVLVLDEFFQSIPIESLPSFRNRSCCRMPSLSLLLSQHSPKVSPLESGWYCIDPDGNLPETAETVGLQFLRPISDRKGWTGFVSAAPPPMEFSRLHAHSDVFIYCGHGGGEQLCSSRKLRRLKCPSMVWLWGCSSGSLKKNGVYQPWGTAINYLLAGSGQVAGALWDVTDKDLDKLCLFAMRNLHGFEDNISCLSSSISDSIVNARMECKMKFAVGAACIIYGLP